MQLPDSPVSPQLSETVEAFISARSKQLEQQKTREGTNNTGTDIHDYSKNDQLRNKSCSDPEHLQREGGGVSVRSSGGFLQKRLAVSIDFNTLRICKPVKNQSSNSNHTGDDKKKAPPIEVEPIPRLGRLSLVDSCDQEKDVKSDVKSNEYPKRTNVEPLVKPKIKNQVRKPRDPVVIGRKTKVEERQRERSEGAGCDVATSEAPPVVDIKPPVSKSTALIVNGREYNLMRELGQGGSSRVFEVYNQKRQLLAIKCVDLSCADKSVREGYLNEIKMLQQLQGSSRIIKLFEHEYNREHKRLYVVMERGDVDLATFINQRSKHKEGITPEMIKFYWSEMLRAVQDIHSAGIIHSDLKPANFLLVAGQLKLIDFGIASAIPDDKTSIIKDNKCGTPSYMSPEALNDIQDYSESGEGSLEVKIKLGVKSDVWSLGCILYHMVYGRTPFQHIRSNLKLQAIMNPTFKIDFPPIKDKLLVDVLKCCIVRNVKQRASVEELLKHPFLTASTFLDCLNELSPSSMAKVSQVLEQYKTQRK